MGTVARRGRTEKRRPAGGRSPREFAEACEHVEHLLDAPTPDPVLRKFLRLGLTGERTKVPTAYLDYPARTHRLTAAEARAVLRALGTWARLTLQLGVGPPQFPRSDDTRLPRLLLNRLCSRDPRWQEARPLPFADPGARGLTRAQLELVAERAPEWAAQLRDPRGPRPDLAFIERVVCVIRAIEGRGKKATIYRHRSNSTVCGLLLPVVTALLPWFPELAELTEYGRYKALLRARARVRRL